MNLVFKLTKDLDVKIMAMRITLFASSYCNRYNAMEVFDNMIQTIKDNQEAVAVTEMLKDNLESYSFISNRVPSNKLHPLIQVIQQKIEGEKAEEIANRNDAINNW
jgi:hypothetical protein